MRLLIFVMLLATVIPVVPTAAAHACSGTAANCVCPVPNDGQAHSHAGPSGSCTNGASATPGGAQAPGPALPAVLVALVVLAALVRRG